MKITRIVSVAAVNAAVFLLYLLYIKLLQTSESILPVILVPSALFIVISSVFTVRIPHIIIGDILIVAYAAFWLSGTFGGMAMPALIVLTVMFIIAELTELLFSRMIRSNIAAIRQELDDSPDDPDE